jgi:hypothetical protein
VLRAEDDELSRHRADGNAQNWRVQEMLVKNGLRRNRE